MDQRPVAFDANQLDHLEQLRPILKLKLARRQSLQDEVKQVERVMIEYYNLLDKASSRSDTDPTLFFAIQGATEAYSRYEAVQAENKRLQKEIAQLSDTETIENFQARSAKVDAFCEFLRRQIQDVMEVLNLCRAIATSQGISISTLKSDFKFDENNPPWSQEIRDAHLQKPDDDSEISREFSHRKVVSSTDANALGYISGFRPVLFEKNGLELEPFIQRLENHIHDVCVGLRAQVSAHWKSFNENADPTHPDYPNKLKKAKMRKAWGESQIKDFEESYDALYTDMRKDSEKKEATFEVHQKAARDIAERIKSWAPDGLKWRDETLSHLHIDIVCQVSKDTGAPLEIEERMLMAYIKTISPPPQTLIADIGYTSVSSDPASPITLPQVALGKLAGMNPRINRILIPVKVLGEPRFILGVVQLYNDDKKNIYLKVYDFAHRNQEVHDQTAGRAFKLLTEIIRADDAYPERAIRSEYAKALPGYGTQSPAALFNTISEFVLKDKRVFYTDYNLLDREVLFEDWKFRHALLAQFYEECKSGSAIRLSSADEYFSGLSLDDQAAWDEGDGAELEYGG